jgi:hypothetical protein
MDGDQGRLVGETPANASTRSGDVANTGSTDKRVLPVPEPGWTPQILAVSVTAGFFSLLFLLCFKKAPDANMAMLNIVLGSLGTAWVGVMSYYFGSSQGGRAKDQMLYQSQPASTSN